MSSRSNGPLEEVQLDRLLEGVGRGHPGGRSIAAPRRRHRGVGARAGWRARGRASKVDGLRYAGAYRAGRAVPAASRTIAERSPTPPERDFVGRRGGARRVLRAAAAAGDAPACWSLFVHRSGRHRQVAPAARRRSAASTAASTTVLLDCREIEPTPAGIHAARSAEALGAPRAGADLGRVARLRARRDGRPAVLDARHLRALRPARHLAAPGAPARACPSSLLTIIAGRDAPGAAWLTTPGWARPGARAAARARSASPSRSTLLRRSRASTSSRRRGPTAFARGHPLALELRRGGAAGRPGPRHRERAAAGRDRPAAGRAARRAPRADHRDAGGGLDLAAGDGARPARAARPARTCATSSTPCGGCRSWSGRRDGLMIHDVVREVIAADLRDRDPELHARYRRRAWSYFEARARRPRRPSGLWEVTADLIYLIQNPVLRAACFPAGSSEHAVEPAVAADGARHPGDRGRPRGARRRPSCWGAGGSASRELLRRPRAGRGRRRHPAARRDLGDIDPACWRGDPVARAWAGPPGRDAAARRATGCWPCAAGWAATRGEMLSPAVGACWLDVKRVVHGAAAAPVAPLLGDGRLRRRSRRSSCRSASPRSASRWTWAGPSSSRSGSTSARGASTGGSRAWWAREIGGAEEAALVAPPAAPAAGAHRARGRGAGADRARACRTAAIGRRLVISEKTAGRHVSNIFCKLGVHNRAQATRMAVECGVGREDGAFAPWRGARRGLASVGDGRRGRPRHGRRPHVTVRRRGRDPRDPRAGAELLVGGPRHPDRERVGELQGHRARRDRDPQQVQGADRGRRLRRHPLPLLRLLPRRGGPPVRRHRGGDRRGRRSWPSTRWAGAPTSTPWPSTTTSSWPSSTRSPPTCAPAASAARRRRRRDVRLTRTRAERGDAGRHLARSCRPSRPPRAWRSR